jgi:KDO2-lipid IV(A) lauroyltransferase
MSLDNRKSPVFERAFLGPRFWPTWVLLGFLWLIAQLPVRANQAIGWCFGWLLFYLAPARKRIAEINIAHCFPELDAKAQAGIVHETIMSCGFSFAETAMGLWGPANKMRDRYEIAGLEYITQAQDEGKGVLLMGSHLTTVDISGLMMSYHIRAYALYRSDPNPLMSYAIATARSRVNEGAIQRNDTRKLIRKLRQGHIVWYAPDQDYQSAQSVFAPFFGIPASTVIATMRIAKMSDAAVIPFFCYREPKGRFRLEIQPPLDNFPSGDDLVDATRVNRVIENAVRVAPGQYLWVHRRFKTRPEGEASFYPKKKKRRRSSEVASSE